MTITQEQIAAQVKRLRAADEYAPLGHDGWETADMLEQLAVQRTVWQQNSRATFEAMVAMRNSINEHIPMPSIESDLLQGPENSVFCAAVAEAVVSAIIAERAKPAGVRVKPLSKIDRSALVLIAACAKHSHACDGGYSFVGTPAAAAAVDAILAALEPAPASSCANGHKCPEGPQGACCGEPALRDLEGEGWMEPITDEWLSSVDFKWRQSDRQPHKHWTLCLNVEDQKSLSWVQTKIEVQRSGWQGKKEYIGDPDSWMLWITDTFDRTAFVGRIRHKSDIIGIAEIITRRKWNPDTHLYGQAWAEDSHVLKERSRKALTP